MNWFETATITSLAKNAFKEAQKTIDKALDIKEEGISSSIPIISTENIKSSKISLEKESENFFQAFGVNNKEINEEPSPKRAVTTNMVGSLWGSFSESFFENQKSTLTNKASITGYSTSAPVTPSGSGRVVATQPPRMKTSHPDSNLKSDVSSSSSSSIVKIDSGEEASSPSSIEFSSIPEEIEEKNPVIPIIDTSTLEEDSLADDAIDLEGFTRSRLIVGSVDSECSSVRLESRSSINSSKSLLEELNLHSVSEEVFCDRINNPSRFDDSSSPPSVVNKSCQSQLESPDSIVVLDSHPNSPIDVSNRDLPVNLEFSINSSDSIEVHSTNSSLASPSSNSIEVLSSSSVDSFHTLEDSSLSDVYLRSIDQQTLGSYKNLTSIEERMSVSDLEGNWIENTEIGSTITKQPLAANKLRHQDTQDSVADLELNDGSTPGHSSYISGISEEGSTSESMHSTSTSSTITIIDFSSVIELSPLNIEDIAEREPSTQTQYENSDVRMNAGEIRKSLDRVGKKVGQVSESSKSNCELSVKVIESCVKLNEGLVNDPQTSIAKNDDYESISVPYEMSSIYDSSTETITSSFDSKLMTWSNAAVIDFCQESPLENQSLMKPIEDLLEEAIADDNTQKTKDEINQVSPFDRELSPSSSDRSDHLKVTSSGHSSADEAETATSSDIEVISSPSIDGSINGTSRLFNVPPSVASKVWMTAQKGFRSFLVDKGDQNRKDGNQHERSDTISSSMTTSFTSISESEGDGHHIPHSELLQLEASRITQVLLQDINIYGKGHRRNVSNLSETSESSAEPQTPETEKLWKKITKLSDVLESRETRVLELSHANISLQESNQTFKKRVEELECLKMGSEATELVREEFTQRLVMMERKFQQALREKEVTKRQLEEFRTEAATSRSNSDLLNELTEKESLVSELRHEGEKLSKQQLNYSNIIKKLRTKEKEAESCTKDQKEKIDSLSSELDRLRKQLNAKEDVERRQIEAIRQYTITHQMQEIQIKDFAAENAEVEGKFDTLKEALDTAYREISELQRSVVTRDAEAQEQALSTEVTARNKLETALTESKKETEREKETLFSQIIELKEDLDRNENQANRKERSLRTEINEFQHRLVEAELRADEISSTVNAATKPLLRQMEHLRSSHATQQFNWDSLEETLAKRLHEAQNLVTLTSKKEREAKEQQADLHNSMSTLQSQLSTMQSENVTLKGSLDAITFKSTSLEEEKVKNSSQMEVLKNSFAEEIYEVKRERDIFEQQLDIEKLSVNCEKKKVQSLLDQLKERDKRLQQLQLVANSRTSSPRSSPTPSLSRLSVAGSINDSFAGSFWGDDVFDPASMKGISVYDSLRGNNAATMEVLTSSLRQREGDLHQLQTEMTRLEAQKESLAIELVQASLTADDLLNTVREFDHVKKLYKDLDQKYNALLQMHGEKVEEVEELKLDLADVKEMYKMQIDQLMQK